MKKENLLLIGAGIIVVGGGYMIWKRVSSNTNESVPEKAVTPIINLSEVSVPDKDLVLSVGSRGDEVKALQEGLKNLTLDGVFGALTLARLVAVTGKNKITLNQYNDFIEKDTDVKFIVGSKKYKSTISLYSFEKEFLKAWSDGIKAVQSVFEYNGKNYNTQGGTASQIKAGTFVVNGVTYRTSDGKIVN